MQFDELPEFQKDFKKLSKKIASLNTDFENFKKFIKGVDFDNNKRNKTLKKDEKKQIRIIKTRLLVKSMKGSSKTRLIFSFCIHEDRIDFIELYLKNNKGRENFVRIQNYLDNL